MQLPSLLLAAGLMFTPLSAGSSELGLPAGLHTHADGRRPIQELYTAYLGLLDTGWRLDIIIRSQPPGADHPLPVIALRSPGTGPATWFIAGIHGEEPAGPMGLADSKAALAAMGEREPVVVLPLLNPHGYARNWRYLNRPDWAEGTEVLSVGDASHRLPHPDHPSRARQLRASSPEAAAIVGFILGAAREHPPRVTVNLHEDSLLDAGYVYSQGKLGARDPLAVLAVATLREHGIAVKTEGETRFGEPIENGIIGPVIDSSIDELLSAPTLVVGNRLQTGPAAATVLVLETPTRGLSLDRRVAAHAALVRRLAGTP